MQYLVVQAYWYFDTMTGEFRYRIKSPGEALADHPKYEVINVHIFHPLFAELAHAADLLILHLLPDNEIEHVIQLRKRMGKPTLFEIADNFLSLGSWVSTDDAHRNPTIRQKLLYHASTCDGLQFSSEELKKTFSFLNPTHIVFENQADHFAREERQRRPLVIGWGGSKGHEQDLARIAPVILDFCSRHEDVVFSYMGYLPIFETHFSLLPESQRRVREAGPIEDYFTFLSTLHVGLAPLSDSEFNRCRSDIKFVEYAAHGVLPILSDAPAYRVHGKNLDNALFFRNNQELMDLLEDLYINPDKLEKMADQASQFASTRRSMVNHIGRRHHFYRRFLKHDAFITEQPELPDCAGLMAHLRVASDHFTSSRLDEALENLDKVLAMHPNYGLAHIMRINTLIELKRPEQVLEEYGNYQPQAIYNDLFYVGMTRAAQMLHLAGWRKVALRIVDPVLRLEMDPEIEPDTETRLRTILKHNPHHYKSLLNLVRVLSRSYGNRLECLGLMDRACFLEPESQALRNLRDNIAMS